MPFNVVRGPANFYDKEILRSATGLDDIKSMLVDSTTVDENPASSGRWVLEAGTVMCKVQSSSKIRPANPAGGEQQADIVGILAAPIEFWIAPDVTAGDATDEPAAILHHGCDFNVSKLVGYANNATAVNAALSTCIFR